VDQTDTPIHGGVVLAEEGNPTAELLTAWLGSRLGVPFSREVSGGPGITQVRFAVDGGDITIDRNDGRLATLSKPGQPDRHVALHRRDTADLMAEELRRLNPDEVYGETLAATSSGLGV
jgi:glucose-6-phosphate dehydrogenase assembly protein OpcA